MLSPRVLCSGLAFVAWALPAIAQTELAASKITPNLVANISRPLRYHPEKGDFVIENGAEFFNRSLYGGNTAFRVDGGDKPEFVLYLPGRGGNLRLGIRAAAGARWLNDAARIEARYRPGELLYEVRDPLLGPGAVLHLAVLAYSQTEGMIVRAEGENVAPAAELIWAYGGVNGQRGKRDGDIGTESVPISQWFQLRPEFCRGNGIEVRATGFTLKARPATILGVVPTDSMQAIADATEWDDVTTLFADGSTAGQDGGRGRSGPEVALPIVIGRVGLKSGVPLYLSLQRIATTRDSEPSDLDTYREVTGPRRAATSKSPGTETASGPDRPVSAITLAAPFQQADLPGQFAEAERHFAALRSRVAVDTPDAFLNAAVGALNVAADAVWDEPQQAIMHGAIAWRTKLLGWRGPYSLDALGWHERARRNFTYWFGRQNTDPVPDRIPPADEKANLARNEAGLHTNGDLSNSHYDMNLVFIDALFRHLQWTGDIAFAKQAWPVIERHLAWERRLFRREFGADKLPLYEAYAAIWASDDLQYSGGGAMHATAYNYYQNRQAARLARLIGADPTPYEHEADLLQRSMRELLWVTDERGGAGSTVMPVTGVRVRDESEIMTSEGAQAARAGWFAENKDWLGLQRVHPDAALWTFYHTVDSEVPTREEAWQMADRVDAAIPHLPVRGPGVPDGLYTLATSDWMPYDWSINNVVMAEAVHGALALWEAGRPAEAWSVTKGSLLAAMFMGISPGNVGSMSYLDVYRRESQRDFADGSGVLSRALVEGLFGVKPDLVSGELRVAPGWPADWGWASLTHPDFSLRFRREGDVERYEIGQHFSAGSLASPLRIRLVLVAPRDRIAAVTVNGEPAEWKIVEKSVGAPRIEVVASSRGQTVRQDSATTVSIQWTGEPIRVHALTRHTGLFEAVSQGQMHWWVPTYERRPSGTFQPREIAGAKQSDDQDLVSSAVDRADGLIAVDASPPAGDGAIDLRGAVFEPVNLTAAFNDRVTQIFKNEYRSPRSPFVSLAIPKQGIGGWAGGVNRTARIDDSGLRAEAAKGGDRITLPNGVPLVTPGKSGARNVLFTSQWDNYPREAMVPLGGHARGICFLLAGSTNPMQSRVENGEIVVAYSDGSTTRLPLVNPTNWWPIEQDYFIDDYQFRRPDRLPTRIDLMTGKIRVLRMADFKGTGGAIPGGAATVLTIPLAQSKALKSVTVRTTANDVVIGLMAATLIR